MPTPPDLTPWRPLLEAVAKRWPDAPRIPMGLVNFHRKNEPFIRTNTEIGDSFEAHRYMADAVLIRWATEFGAWWTTYAWMRDDDPGEHYYSVRHLGDPGVWYWTAYRFDPDASENQRRRSEGDAPTLLSAHAAAVGAIAGGD